MKRLILLIIALLFSLSGITYALPTPGLVAYYPLDGNANDASGNGRDGTEHNGITYVDAVVGQGALFDGVNDYIDVPDGLFPQVTVSAYISYGLDYVPANAQGYHTAAAVNGWSHGIENFNLAVTEQDGEVKFSGHFHDWLDKGTEGYQVYPETVLYSDEPVQQDCFYHVATTYDGDIHRLYVDGAKVAEVATNSTLGKVHPWAIPDIRLGIDRWDSGFFTGILDDVRIYDRALTDAEIGQLAAPTPIPEPSTLLLLGSASLFGAAFRKKCRT